MPDSHRCYTKSGDIEKYEGGMTVTVNVGDITSNIGYVTEPDQDGNYQINPTNLGVGIYVETTEVTDYYIMTDYKGKKVYKYYKVNKKTLTSSDITLSFTPVNTDSNASCKISITIPNKCTATLTDPESLCSYGFYSASFIPSIIYGGTTQVTMSVKYKKYNGSGINQYYTCIGKSIKVSCTADSDSSYTGSASKSEIVFSSL